MTEGCAGRCTYQSRFDDGIAKKGLHKGARYRERGAGKGAKQDAGKTDLEKELFFDRSTRTSCAGKTREAGGGRSSAKRMTEKIKDMVIRNGDRPYPCRDDQRQEQEQAQNDVVNTERDLFQRLLMLMDQLDQIVNILTRTRPQVNQVMLLYPIDPVILCRRRQGHSRQHVD